MFVPIVLGTGREGRRSESVARKVEELITNLGIATEIIDVRQSELRYTGDSGNTDFIEYWRTTVEKSQAIIIVVPEYNHGYPGELKLFLDTLFSEYENKVVGIVSVANGLWGGTRVTEQLRPVLNAYNMIVLGMAIHLRNVGSMIDQQGEYNNPELPQFVELMIDKISKLATRLHPITVEK